MSRRALLLAVRDDIRDVLKYAARDCDLTLPGGQPPPRCGKWFIGIWPGSRRNQGRTALDATYELTVTLTARVNEPFDRVAIDLLAKNETGFWDRSEAIAELIHKDCWDTHVITRANAILKDDYPYTSNEPVGFRESLTFMSDSVPRLVGGDWFHARPDATEVGIVQDIYFGRARRIQNLANLTEDLT